ncbi:MAG: M23 family peptidase [Verrucomicrobia bacterium]|nr:MAG: M23 family peptidase [Verrucomicrobiota bacterium]PYK50496.1 MAG: M23 family peptidase [Verrucomicrobiota bacterium]
MNENINRVDPTMRLFAAAIVIAIFLSIAMRAQPAQEHALDLVLPTDNDALFSGDGAAFYQYVERDYKGVKSTPWEGGQYGFVRDPTDTAGGPVYTRFHEGIDIRPMHRDSNGEPLDEVRAIADGKVVHTNLVPGYSNYGKYIVIEHHSDGSSYYSLYGHLSSIRVHPGDSVKRGQPIAIMGYTGVGINRERAHLHLELDLMFSHQFEAWHNAFFRNDPNHNGIYNGLNLAGLDIARLYLALHKNPSITIPEFLSGEETFYKVTLPNSHHFELPKLYPWMLAGVKRKEESSWEVSFARSGVPLKIEPSDKHVTQPELSYIKKSSINYSSLTRDIVSGRGATTQLTGYGSQLMRLLIWPD